MSPPIRRRGAGGPPRGDSRGPMRLPEAHETPPPESESTEATWIVGRRALAEAIEEGLALDRIWIADEPGALGWWRAFEARARTLGAVVTRSPRSALDRLARGAVHQGALARAAEAHLAELEDVLEGAAAPALLVLADGVEDPRNLGALIRSAAAAGCHGVLLPERRSAGLTPTTAKAAAGALSRIPVGRVKNVQRALESMGEHGIWTVGLEAGAPPLWTVDLVRPTCIVVGGEGRGLSRLARERCDGLAGIPLQRGVESLNTSVAAAIALFEAVRQRQAAQAPPAQAHEPRETPPT